MPLISILLLSADALQIIPLASIAIPWSLPRARSTVPSSKFHENVTHHNRHLASRSLHAIHLVRSIFSNCGPDYSLPVSLALIGSVQLRVFHDVTSARPLSNSTPFQFQRPRLLLGLFQNPVFGDGHDSPRMQNPIDLVVDIACVFIAESQTCGANFQS